LQTVNKKTNDSGINHSAAFLRKGLFCGLYPVITTGQFFGNVAWTFCDYWTTNDHSGENLNGVIYFLKKKQKNKQTTTTYCSNHN